MVTITRVDESLRQLLLRSYEVSPRTVNDNFDETSQLLVRFHEISPVLNLLEKVLLFCVRSHENSKME